MKLSTAAGLLALALVPQGWAQTANLAERLSACRLIAQDKERLACFDALAGPPAGSGQWGAPSANAVATTGAAQPANAPEARFGLKADPKEPERIESAIAGAFNGWKDRQRLRLANGQVWEITDGTSGYYLTIQNPKVSITKGAMGGFFMKIESVPQQLRVKRVQ